MNEKKLAEELRVKLTSHIRDLDLPWFFVAEIENMLYYLNFYKLKNLNDNIHMLDKYLDTLKNQYLLEIDSYLLKNS